MQHRIFNYDLIRTTAIICVIAIHTENITTSPTNYLGGISWWMANALHSFASVSVPLFIMLTGALILQKSSLTYKYIFSKVLKQFVIPLLFWWVFLILYSQYKSTSSLNILNELKSFFLTEIGHLYFLQIVIGLYLVAPFFHRLIRISSLKLQYMIFFKYNFTVDTL
jgi:surface polysaccharide O-acyltransferase-like enzyme